MKQLLILIFSVLLAIIGIFVIFSVIKINPKGVGGLQVTTNIKSNVYLNDKLLGNTPICKCDPNDTVDEGEYELKILPEDKNYAAFSYKIKVNKSVVTAIERIFLPNESSSTYILTLEKIESEDTELIIASIPDKALVSIDNVPQGITPLLLKKVSKGEHDIEITKDNHNKKTIRVKSIPSYKLIAYVMLGKNTNANNKTDLSLTPTQTLEKTSTTSANIKIKDTPTGFLRVRENPSTASKEISRVTPGDEFLLLDEDNGWFKIKLEDNSIGWISGNFAEKTPN